MQDKGLTTADKRIQSDILKDVKLLISIDEFAQFILGQRKYLVVNTFFSIAGIIPYGPLQKWSYQNSKITKAPLCARVICQELHEVKKLWELKAISITKESMSPSETAIVT